MKVSDVMTSPVLTIEAESTLLQAVRIMLRRNISGFPVVDKQGRLGPGDRRDPRCGGWLQKRL